MNARRATIVGVALALGLGCGDSPSAPPAATYLLFTGQPPDDTVGSPLAGVQVTAYTASGIVAAGFNGAVTITLATNPGNATLSGTVTRTAAFGIATFTDLVVSKAEDGYVLTATAAGVTPATSGTFDVAEVAQRFTLRYAYGLDLETGTSEDCSTACTSATRDFRLAYNSVTSTHSRVFQYAAREIAHLVGQAFSTVHLADTVGATFSSALVDEPFDNTRTILIRTDAGNVYKLGNTVEFGTTGADSVRFHAARLN